MNHACCKAPCELLRASLLPGDSRPPLLAPGRGRAYPTEGLRETSILPRQENKTEETVKLHLYASSAGTERERRGAIANVLAKDGANDELARGNRLLELPCASSPPTRSTATKQKKHQAL